MFPKKTIRPVSPLPTFVDEESSSHYFEAADPAWVREWRREDAASAPMARNWLAVLATRLLPRRGTTDAGVVRHQAQWLLAVGLGLFLSVGLGGALRGRAAVRRTLNRSLGIEYAELDASAARDLVGETPSDAAGAAWGAELCGHAPCGGAPAVVAVDNDALDREHALQQRVRAMFFAKYNHALQADADSAAVQRDILVEVLLRGARRADGGDGAAIPSTPRTVVVRVSTVAESFAAYYFLEQVQYGLWTGATFVANAPTHLELHPAPTFPAPGASNATGPAAPHPLVEDWRALGLHLLPRPEEAAAGLGPGSMPPLHHHHHPGVLTHDPYTLCFAPAGDATVLHLLKVPRPDRTEEVCAGRVVRGRAVLEELFGMETAGPDHRLPHPVEIVEMRFLGPAAVDDSPDEKGWQAFRSK